MLPTFLALLLIGQGFIGHSSGQFEVQPSPSSMGCTGIQDCPIVVYFVLDTSESVAIPSRVYGDLVDSSKIFTKNFVERAIDEDFNDRVKFTWEFGGLHFSDRVVIFSNITANRNDFLADLDKIEYIGRGTHTDCALKAMTDNIKQHTSYDNAIRFAIVITDGHVTRNDCGGMQQMAEAARDANIRVFAVTTDDLQNEIGLQYEHALKTIANLPHELYRSDYAVASATNEELPSRTIDRIYDVMRREAFLKCYKMKCLTFTGSSGLKGFKGRKGEKGTTGAVGDPGDSGRPGDPGIEGPIGFPGPKGYPGMFGEKGEMGSDGMKWECWITRSGWH